MLAEILLVATLAMDYDTTRLGAVDKTPKSVAVDVRGTPEFNPFSDKVYQQVKRFYQAHAVQLEFRTKELMGERAEGVPGVFILPRADYLGTVGISMMDTYGVSYTGIDLVLMLDDRKTCFDRRLSGDEMVSVWSRVMAHELGHLFGLVHPDASVLDGIEAEYDGKRNLMNSQTSALEESVLQPLQEEQIHSYLSRGKIYCLVKRGLLFYNIEQIDKAIAKGQKQ
jgi:hypothetical protein